MQCVHRPLLLLLASLLIASSSSRLSLLTSRLLSRAVLPVALAALAPPLATLAASGASSQAVQSLKTVYLFRDSLQYIDDDIEKGVDARGIVNEIRTLYKNYNLKENVRTALSMVDSNQRADAKEHGLQAVEDIAAIYEYFEDKVDNQSGTRTPPKEVLLFSKKAILASGKELGQFLSYFPDELIKEVSSPDL